jgi:hypothetical protein
VSPAAVDAPAVGRALRNAGRRAAAGQAHPGRGDHLARERRWQEAGEPARAGAKHHHPPAAAISLGDALFQLHDLRQRHLYAAKGARRQQPEPVPALDERQLRWRQAARHLGLGRGIAQRAGVRVSDWHRLS